MKKIILVSFLLCFILSISANAGEIYKFVTKWGCGITSRGMREYSLTLKKVAVDRSGDVYVHVNDGRLLALLKFSSNGEMLSPIYEHSFANFCIAPSGSIYIFKSDNNIVVLDSNFNILRTISPTATIYPNIIDMAVDSSGNIYIVDFRNDCIKKLNPEGGLLTQWGREGTENGEFDSPWGIAIDSSGNVYVSDKNNNRIQKFDSNGTYISQWGGRGTGKGQFNDPWQLTIDSHGYVYVADSRNNRIQKFDQNGRFINQWGRYGSRDGQFHLPISVAVDTSNNVYVMDYANSRIQKFARTFEIEREVIPLVPPRGVPR